MADEGCRALSGAGEKPAAARTLRSLEIREQGHSERLEPLDQSCKSFGSRRWTFSSQLYRPLPSP